MFYANLHIIYYKCGLFSTHLFTSPSLSARSASFENTCSLIFASGGVHQTDDFFLFKTIVSE